jgi:DNA repair exonuclease SbcCD ATPase subunit
MRITAIIAHDAGRRFTITLAKIKGPLTAIYGPTGSGKSAVADLIGHAVFGKHRVAAPGHSAANGELVVEGPNGRYRIRASHDLTGHTRLTVSALNDSPIDHHTIRKLVGNLSPVVLTPLCAVSFREPPDLAKLLSPEFVVGFQRVTGEGGAHGTRRVTELAARRDLLAQELETRISTERRASKELEARWRELDRLVRDEQQQAAAAEQRLKAVENSLAETDARLRYRRIELNVELRWQTSEPHDMEQPAELDGQISRCRQILAELSERESSVRARLAQVQTARANSVGVLTDQQAWLAVSRQLAADLTGEVARLARASASQQCVCHDAHPRLRPIAETIERQLCVLEKSIEDQRQAINAAELTVEVDHLNRAQTELRRHLEHLLERNQSHLRVTAAARQDADTPPTLFSAADAEQLESRRLELEQDRFRLVEQVNSAARKLKVLRAEREAIQRERASLLSARSIEHIQRELAHVQKKLENSGNSSPFGDEAIADDCLMQASDFLAQLTNGDIRRLILSPHGRKAVVVNHHGETVPIDSLTAAEHDQVYLSLCLAILSAASGHGVWLPLVLDDPFERLDARGTAALAAVLEAFSRRGHQVILFTRQKDASDRLAAVGADTYDMFSLRQPLAESLAATSTVSQQSRARESRASKRDGSVQMERRRRRKKKSAGAKLNSDSAGPQATDRSDAA